MSWFIAHRLVLLLALGLLCMAAAIVLMFKPRVPAAVPAYAGLLALHESTCIYLTDNAITFWLLCTVIITAIHIVMPKKEPEKSRVSTLYITLGGAAAMMLAMAADPRFMVLGVILGALLGTLAYCKTPKGKWVKFPSLTFIHYFCAKGLPLIIALAMMGIAVQGFLCK